MSHVDTQHVYITHLEKKNSADLTNITSFEDAEFKAINKKKI